MKKLIQFSLATMLAITLVACDNANQKSNSQNTTKTETPLSAKEQFRQDYEAFTNWQKQTQQKFDIESAKLQQKTAEHSQNPQPEEIKQVLGEFRNQVMESNQALDALNLKDENINSLAQKIKEVYVLSVDTFDLIIQSVDSQNNDEKMLAVQEKLQYIQLLQNEVQEMGLKLEQLYQQ